MRAHRERNTRVEMCCSSPCRHRAPSICLCTHCSRRRRRCSTDPSVMTCAFFSQTARRCRFPRACRPSLRAYSTLSRARSLRGRLPCSSNGQLLRSKGICLVFHSFRILLMVCSMRSIVPCTAPAFRVIGPRPWRCASLSLCLSLCRLHRQL